MLVDEERVKALSGWVNALTKHIKTGVKERAAAAEGLQSKQNSANSLEHLSRLKVSFDHSSTLADRHMHVLYSEKK